MTLFQIAKADALTVALPAEIDVPFTVKEFRIVAADRVVSPLIVTSPDTDTLDRAATPLTVTPLLIVTAPDRVETPSTVIPPVVVEFVMVADDSVAVAFPADIFPITSILFRIVAVDTVRSPLILTVFETLRYEINAVALPADKVVPLTVRLLSTVNPDTVARALTPSAELM